MPLPFLLSGTEFVRRIAQHILPSGFRKVRHYGLYAPGGASVRRERARALVADEPEADEADDVVEKAGDETEQEAREPCPSCGVDAVQRVFLGAVSRPRARGPP